MRLDVVRNAKGAAVELVAVAETQFVATGHGVFRQLETALGSRQAVEGQVEVLQYRTRGIQHAEFKRGGLCDHRIAGILELTTDYFYFHPVAGAIQRAVGKSVKLGVVDFAVVIKILGDEYTAFAVFTEHVRALRAGVRQAQQALFIGAATAHHTQTVTPQHLGPRHRAALLFVRSPDQQLVAGDLAHRHGVGNEYHGGRTVLTHQRFNQIQPRLELA